MKKLILSMGAVLLATGAAAALAAKEDRSALTQCKASIKAVYGDHARARLRSIHRTGSESRLRIMTTPESGGNTLLVCTVSRDGDISLTNRDGIALTPSASTSTKVVTLAR